MTVDTAPVRGLDIDNTVLDKAMNDSLSHQESPPTKFPGVILSVRLICGCFLSSVQYGANNGRKRRHGHQAKAAHKHVENL